MRKDWFIIIIVLIIPLGALYGQKENNVWTFGIKAGLNFNNGAPQAITTSVNDNNPGVDEGVASVCNTEGRLQFYTNGNIIWNRNHVRMPNGNLGLATESTTQGALIVPVPGSETIYYVFSIEASDLTTRQRFYYSIVDMSLNNGLGDVVSTSKAIHLADSISERMTAVAGDNCDIWVVVKNDFKGEYWAYRITSSGLNTVPVISTVNTSNFPGILGQCAMIKFSHSRRKLISANHTSVELLEMADFNPATGIVSNNVIIDQTKRYYAACFSPDDKRLYVSTNYGSPSELIQYDLTPGLLCSKLS